MAKVQPPLLPLPWYRRALDQIAWARAYPMDTYWTLSTDQLAHGAEFALYIVALGVALLHPLVLLASFIASSAII